MSAPDRGQDTAATPRPQVPVILVSAEQAEAAFAAYTALLRQETAEPALRRNPYWQPLRDSAFARFRAAFEVMP